MPIGKFLAYDINRSYEFIILGKNEKFVYATELAKADIKISANMNLADITFNYSIVLTKNHKKQAINIKILDNKITNINIPQTTTV